MGVRARYGDNRNGAFKESGKVTVAAPSPEPTPEPAQRGETKDDSSKTRTDPPGNEAEEKEPESAEQQADPCASLEIAEVGGWASNGYALWVWKGSPLDDGGCWVDFKLSYSDDYGATFTEAAVVRRYMHTTATEYRYSISTVPEMSIVSQLQVQVCAPDSDTCPRTLKSTDASFDQYYYSRHENKTAGANTKALLVPANSSEGGNASVTGWLEYDGTETHTNRIAMTAGKTYIFDETYRTWALDVKRLVRVGRPTCTFPTSSASACTPRTAQENWRPSATSRTSPNSAGRQSTRMTQPTTRDSGLISQ